VSGGASGSSIEAWLALAPAASADLEVEPASFGFLLLDARKFVMVRLSRGLA
jgi:hypothetical protein